MSFSRYVTVNTEMKDMFKRYVDVLEIRKKDGTLIPVRILWNHDEYVIEKILHREHRVSDAGGVGICYRVLVQGHYRNLFLEKDKCFIESGKDIDYSENDQIELSEEELSKL